MKDYSKVTTPALRQQLAGLTNNLREGLLEASRICVELDCRNEPHPAREAIPRYKEIAEGTLDPLAALAFAEDRRLLAEIVQLPVAEQRRLASDGRVVVALAPAGGQSGAPVAAEKRFGELRPHERMMVVRGGKIRSFDEQKADLVAVRVLAEGRRNRSSTLARIEGDPSKDELIVGQIRIPWDHPDLLRAAAVCGRLIGYSAPVGGAAAPKAVRQ